MEPEVPSRDPTTDRPRRDAMTESPERPGERAGPSAAGKPPRATLELEHRVFEPDPCWRCGGEVTGISETCGVCSAPLTTAARRRSGKVTTEPSPVIKVIFAFSVLLVTSIVHGVVVASGATAYTPDSVLFEGLVVEAVFTATVLLSLAWVSLPPRLRRPSPSVRLASWLLSVPLLGVLLSLNFGYHTLLREWVGVAPREGELRIDAGSLGLAIFVLCVQPAVVEELFFRFLALGTLRRVAGTHSAIFISSVMFGLAHIGVPFSVPVLIVLGIAFGYARVTSGGLALPMILHFSHNLIVFWVDPSL